MKLLVYVFRRPNMLKVNENLYNMLGVGELEKLYTIEGYKTTQDCLELFYPERFLNILEIRCLTTRLEEAGYKEVAIITCSEHLVTTVKNTDIRVVQDELIQEGFKLSNDESGMPFDGGLGVL